MSSQDASIETNNVENDGVARKIRSPKLGSCKVPTGGGGGGRGKKVCV